MLRKADYILLAYAAHSALLGSALKKTLYIIHASKG
jgi:hypothetical protein